jgi:adenylyltransferase/sulfurtransferase
MDIADLEATHASLSAQISAAESQLAALKESLHATEKLMRSTKGGPNENSPQKWPLLEDEYKRYGRQMIVSQIGLQGLYNYKLSKRQPTSVLFRGTPLNHSCVN